MSGLCSRVALCCAIALCTPAACTREAPNEQHQARAASVRVIAPIQRELPRFIRATGTLHGEEETTIAAKVSGRIVETLRDLGDRVAPGEPLVRIDPTDYELALRERQHAFAEALAQLGLTEIPPADFQIDALPGVELARLQAENARSKFERGRALVAEEPPVISEQDFADLRTAWEIAQSSLKMERLRAQATLAEARTLAAQVAVAQQRVLDTVLRAPQAPAGQHASPDAPPTGQRDYEVAARMVTVGDFVQVAAPVVRLVDADPLKLRVQVPERRLGAVQHGQQALIAVEAIEERFPGRVSRVSPAVDAATRGFAVEILVPNADRRLKPGSFATAQIEIGREQALLAPQSALITFAGVHKVLLVEDGKIKEQGVEVGERVDELIEIRDGLAATDQVVARPTAALANGTPVSVTEVAGEVAGHGHGATP